MAIVDVLAHACRDWALLDALLYDGGEMLASPPPSPPPSLTNRRHTTRDMHLNVRHGPSVMMSTPASPAVT